MVPHTSAPVRVLPSRCLIDEAFTLISIKMPAKQKQGQAGGVVVGELGSETHSTRCTQEQKKTRRNGVHTGELGGLVYSTGVDGNSRSGCR